METWDYQFNITNRKMQLVVTVINFNIRQGKLKIIKINNKLYILVYKIVYLISSKDINDLLHKYQQDD